MFNVVQNQIIIIITGDPYKGKLQEFRNPERIIIVGPQPMIGEKSMFIQNKNGEENALKCYTR